MLKLLKSLCTAMWLPLAWTVMTIVLLCLPGSVIPNKGVFSIEGEDKVIHIILFGGITLFWGLYMTYKKPADHQWWKLALLITAFSISLGIVLEYLQLYYIPNRSFDIFDIIADSIGAVLAFFTLLIIKRKLASKY